LAIFLPNVRKILIINIFGIGDVLFTTPLIANIKTNFPQMFVGYVANRRTAPLVLDNPKIDRVFIYERDEYHALYRKSRIRFLKRFLEDLKAIQKENFDLVIDFTLNGNTSFLMWLIGIKERMGFNFKNRSPFLTRKIKLEGYEGKHIVEYYLTFCQELGLPLSEPHMEIPISQEEEYWAQKILQRNNLSWSKPLVGLVPGGGASWGKEAVYKLWSAENYAKLADKIVEKFAAAIILMGDQQEKDLCARVAKSMQHKPILLAGQTTIKQLAALCALCRCVIVNDGGPLHVAVTAGAKTVSIFGPVDEKVYGPYPSENHVVVTKDIACRPCYRRFRRAQCEHISCLSTLTVEEVFERIREVL